MWFYAYNDNILTIYWKKNVIWITGVIFGILEKCSILKEVKYEIYQLNQSLLMWFLLGLLNHESQYLIEFINVKYWNCGNKPINWWGIAICNLNCDFRPPVVPWRWLDIYEAGTCQWMDWCTSWDGETFRWPRLMLSLIRILSIQSLTDRRWVYMENSIVLPPPFQILMCLWLISNLAYTHELIFWFRKKEFISKGLIYYKNIVALMIFLSF